MVNARWKRPLGAAVSQHAVIVPLGRVHELQNTTTEPDQQQSADAAREERIDTLRLQLLGTRDPEARRELWQRLKEEIGARSPAQVERMEHARGLVRGGN